MDFIKAEQTFKEYLKGYDLENGSIKLKAKHTYGVVRCSEYIAKSLNLDKEDIELAKLIALLHDIGRFEQVKVMKSFEENRGFNHAQYGVEILFKDNMIRKFIEEDKYDEIIYKAILNHSKYKIEGEFNDKELLHSNIIRDADKLDNFRVKETEKMEDMFLSMFGKITIEYDDINKKVYDDFLNHKSILLQDRKNQIDSWVCILAFIFDLNFEVSLKYIKDNNYINRLIDRIEYKNKDTKNKMEDLRECANKYIEEKINNK